MALQVTEARHYSDDIKFPVGNLIFKIKNINTKTRCEICLELTIKAPERRSTSCSSVSIFNLEQVDAGWV